MLSDDERNTLRELERQFTVRPVTLFYPHRLDGRQSRFAEILALAASLIFHATLLAVSSLGVALQPATVPSPESEAMSTLHRLFAEARRL